MVKVGDHITLASNATTRSGVVTGLNGLLIRVRWENGSETNVIPGPGTLTVVAPPSKAKAKAKPNAKAKTKPKADAPKKAKAPKAKAKKAR